MKEHSNGAVTQPQLEALYWAYIDSRGLDSDAAKQEYQKLDQLLQEFSWKNKMMCSVR